MIFCDRQFFEMISLSFASPLQRCKLFTSLSTLLLKLSTWSVPVIDANVSIKLISRQTPSPFRQLHLGIAEQPLLEQLLQLQRPDVRRIHAGEPGLQVREALGPAALLEPKDLTIETLVIALQVLLVETALTDP